MYYSATATGFARHQVTVRPLAILIRPGESIRYRVRVSGPGDRLPDSGWITWLGNNGITVRIPVVIAR
jgi:minor extracellular serine protease Vpr